MTPQKGLSFEYKALMPIESFTDPDLSVEECPELNKILLPPMVGSGKDNLFQRCVVTEESLLFRLRIRQIRVIL